MSDSTSEVRCAAMLMLFDAYSAKCAEVEALRKALEQIANGDPSRVYSPIGALHAAGMVTQWEQDAAIARAALGTADQPDDVQAECSYPDCGCTEARVCVAKSGANHAAMHVNLPKRTAGSADAAPLCPHGLYPWNCRDCTPVTADEVQRHE